MELVKNKRPNESSGQCQAMTNDGSRCSRDARKKGYCHQHYRLKKKAGLIVDAKGNEQLTEIPQPPEMLEPHGRRQWQMYCKYLIDKGLLFEVYLSGIANLCYLEDELEEAKQKIQDHGVVNFYENGIQRNGFASHFDKLLGHIRNLRADYGLTVASSKEASSDGGSGKSGEPKQGFSGKKSF